MGKFKRWLDPDGYGNGTWGRQIDGGLFHVIEITDMDDACGKDNNGRPKYVVELCAVDVDTAPEKLLKEAKDFVGYEGSELVRLAEALFSYGSKGKLHSVDTDNRAKGFQECRQGSYHLTSDPEAMYEAMKKPTNALGSTVLECMQGDMHSAIMRGVVEGERRAKIMAKMYGADDETIKAIETYKPGPPVRIIMHRKFMMDNIEDPIAHWAGFTDGFFGRLITAPRKDLAKAYMVGYKKGVAVRTGSEPKPDWMTIP